MTKKSKVVLDKTPQPTTEAPAKPKYMYDEYYDYFTFKMRPVSDQWIDALAHELLDWATTNDNAFKITQFYHMKGIGSDDIKRWRERNKNLDVAYVRALEMLGNRREIGAIKGKLKEGIVLSSMPMYDKKWKSLAEWRAALRNKSEEEKTVKVLLEHIPSSDIVPDKKKESNGD
jgi:hypothetical protein